ncbi:MAG: hypothetical protein IPK13_01610 [Deltaproteobacteria bacterium]|nr:hypothetical protein [Deltaproteobacteria bacterium]
MLQRRFPVILLRGMLLCSVFGLSACGSGQESPPPPAVGGDAGVVDAATDATQVDAGQVDDAALGDAGGGDAAAADGGEGDAAVDDANAGDANVDDAGEPDGSGGDGGSMDGGEADGGFEDGGLNLEVQLRDCLGRDFPIALSQRMPYYEATLGAQAGHFLLDVGTNYSTIDLAAFAVPPATRGCDASLLGVSCTFDEFSLFHGPSTVFLTTSDFSRIQGTVRQAGIIGTDFLSLDVLTLSWSGARAYVANENEFCEPRRLEAVDMAALPTTGFYSNDFSNLRPLTEVIPDAEDFWTVPNIPTVPVRVAGVDAVAQIDSAFADSLVPYSLNINEALLDAILAAHPEMITRDDSLDLFLTTCAGVSEPVEGYRVEPGATLQLIDEVGHVAVQFDDTVLFAKRTPEAAKVCGGIGTWDVPAAQIAVSFLADRDFVVFDPFASRVWVARSRT